MEWDSFWQQHVVKLLRFLIFQFSFILSDVDVFPFPGTLDLSSKQEVKKKQQQKKTVSCIVIYFGVHLPV